AQQELAFAALHDRLTRLPNRLLLLDRIGQAVDAGRATTTSIAVVYLDLDHFKVVNESLGYDVGDALLVAVGNELSTVVRPGDTVSRISGDGFAICLQGLTPGDPDDDPCTIASGMLRRLAELPDLGGEAMFIGASAGVAINDAHSDAEQLLSDAEAAMYRAKELGRGRVELFDAEARARVIGRLVLQGELRNALHRDEFRLFFQPQVRIATGEIVGFEALLRWDHPERGLLAPAAFIDVAEESGLIEPIGRWVLEDACRQVAEWRQRFAETRLRVSVNLSARQLVDDTLPDVVARVLNDAGIDPTALCLELTESMLMEDAEHAVATLRRLKETGVRLAIDDFGTGYSSLAYLKRFPIDELKVDRSFVAGLGRDPEDFVIVSAVANLATSLGVEMVAEGVENVRHLTELESLGCPLAQGYLWSPPVPAAAVPALLARPVVRPSHGPSTPDDSPGTASNARAQAHQAIDVVSLLAHELRAPLTVIRGYAETMSAHLDGSSPTVGRACAAIARNVTHLDDLVATLTDVNALETGTLPLHRRPTDVTHVVRTLLGDHGGLFVDNPVTVEATSEDTEAYVDESRVHQILLNLLTNAAKFSPAGERIAVVVGNDASGEGLEVRVVDNGPGVAPELSREIFRKFFRADRANKGTGLGLYVARSLARAHGGELSCRQAPAGGAEFVLTLPRVRRASGSHLAAPAPDVAPTSTVDVENVRVPEPDFADDAPHGNPALAATLSTAYAALDEAETPEQAVGAVITLLRDLGGGTVVARDADATALPYEVSCGIGEATLASAPPGSEQRATIERVLPQFLETATATVLRTSATDHGPDPRVDPVTGFAGRRLAARAIGRLREGSGVALVGADDDDGLRALARLVRAIVPRHAWVGRFGDDRIAILFPVGPETAPAETAALLREAWAHRYPSAPALDAGTAVVGRRGTEVALVAADAASRRGELAVS
ncbi:MAG TPA: EAL domain-containing protein, partial [Acidimicrobiales bacterium]